jgi:hypothetical protein
VTPSPARPQASTQRGTRPASPGCTDPPSWHSLPRAHPPLATHGTGRGAFYVGYTVVAGEVGALASSSPNSLLNRSPGGYNAYEATATAPLKLSSFTTAR